jgi:large subunit ribosomal protein L17
MRHKNNRVTKLAPGAQKYSLLMRNLLTSLVTSGKVVTTQKRAKALCAEADSFFARLVRWSADADQAAGQRVVIATLKQTLFTEDAGKKVINELLPAWTQANKVSGFAQGLKLGPRKGDAAEEMLVRLVG